MTLHLEPVGLGGKRILIVEDDYILAMSMSQAIQEYGGHVVGPVPSIEAALRFIEEEGQPDAAVLDIRLGEDTSFPLAAALREKGVPLFFVTGFDDWFLPQELDDVPVYQKPTDPENVVRLLMEALPKNSSG